MNPPKNKLRLTVAVAVIVSTFIAILGPSSTLKETRGYAAANSANSWDTGEGNGANSTNNTRRRIRGNVKISGNVVALPRVAGTPQRAHPTPNVSASSPFERHYLSVYQKMMIRRETPPRFVLYSVKSNGWGNKVRSLNGAMFLAAITDRVLLVKSDSVSMLFHPPAVGGVVLDWDHTLANGTCEEDGKGTVKLRGGLTDREYALDLVGFPFRYGKRRCLVVGAPFGHDRLVVTLNEDAYRDKVTKLFGGMSRYGWSRAILGLVLQRPRGELVRAAADAMRRLELDATPQSHRVAVHLRTFSDAGKKWHDKVVTDIREKYWGCVETLLRNRITSLNEGQQGNGTSVKVLFLSDDGKMKKEAGERLKTLAGCQIINSGLPVTHTEAANTPIESFLEWFLVGECGTVIATGYSSFGLTAFFRPSALPATTDSSSKVLFTVDGLGEGITDSLNPKCGRIEPSGYGDINFGLMDPPYNTKMKFSVSTK